MDRKPVSGPEKRDQGGRTPETRHRRAAGLEIVERDGHWHIHGTVYIDGRARRVRKSTRLPATDEYWDAADRQRDQIKGEVKSGKPPTVPLAIGAEKYLSRTRARPLGQTTIGHIQKMVRRFGRRPMRGIEDHEWVEWVDHLHAGNASETRERFLNSVLAFLTWAHKKPRRWIDAVPDFDRDNAARNPNRRKRRRIADLTPELIAYMIGHAAPHLKGQLAAEWSTGARVASIIYGCRVCDVLLTPGRSQITFHNTKNGLTVDAALHPWAAARLAEYAEWRGRLHEREAPFFLTHRRRPYSPNGKFRGGQNKTAFNGMKRRAIAALKAAAAGRARDLNRAGRRADARQTIAEARETAALIGQVTQHWFRHMLATNMLRATDKDLRAVMEQLGWLDVRSAMAYAHDVPDYRHRVVAALDIGVADGPDSHADAGTSLTRAAAGAGEPDAESDA